MNLLYTSKLIHTIYPDYPRLLLRDIKRTDVHESFKVCIKPQSHLKILFATSSNSVYLLQSVCHYTLLYLFNFVSVIKVVFIKCSQHDHLWILKHRQCIIYCIILRHYNTKTLYMWRYKTALAEFMKWCRKC